MVNGEMMYSGPGGLGRDRLRTLPSVLGPEMKEGSLLREVVGDEGVFPIDKGVVDGVTGTRARMPALHPLCERSLSTE